MRSKALFGLARTLRTACALCALAACSSSEDNEDDAAAAAVPDAAEVAAPGAGMTTQMNPVSTGSSDAGRAPSTPANDAAAPRDAGRSDSGMMMPPTMTPPASSDGGAMSGGPAMPSAGCGKTMPPPSGSTMIDVDGMQRQFIVKAPTDYDASKPHRLVFAWHGLGGTAMMIASNYYGLTTRSGNSTIFIAPQGLPNPQQNNLAAWGNQNDGDITFTRKMLDWAKSNYCVDEKRVFSIGMSNGGMFSNIVGCELGGTFRAIVAMSGGGPRGYAMKPRVGQVAVWISHGNKDNNVPFSYGQMSRDYWTKTNHCGTTTMPAMPGSCLEYQGCDADFPVQFCEFDGGHMVPAFAGEAAWTFFSRF